MSRVRIIIATTTNPSTVQRITEEDPVVSSVVCLSGKAVALPISPAYDAFVRDPTGVIQRHFGHSAFRVDVSETIDDGYSWQLGLFMAHALQSADQLATLGDGYTKTLITTGEIDRDLNVLGVHGNDEKISALRDFIKAQIDKGEKLVLVLPRANRDPWAAAYSELIEKNPGQLEILAIDRIDQILTHLGVTLERQNQNAVDGTATPVKNKPWMAIFLLVLLAAGAVAGGVSYSPEIKRLSRQLSQSMGALPNPFMNSPDSQPAVAATALPDTASGRVAAEPKKSPSTPQPANQQAAVQPAKQLRLPQEARLSVAVPAKKPMPPAPPQPTATREDPPPPPIKRDVPHALNPAAARASPARIELSELRAPVGFTCAEAHQMKIEAQRRPDAMGRAIRLFGKANDRLCMIEIAVTSQRTSDHLFGRYQRWTQGGARKQPPDKVIDLGPRTAAISWSVDIPSRLLRPAVFQVLVLSAPVPLNPSDKILKQLNKIRPGNDSLVKIQKRLLKSNLSLTVKRFRILPDLERSQSPRPNSGQFDRLRPAPK